MTRVLVTGGAGFIGSHTADLLLKNGYKVRILDNLNPKTHLGGWPQYLDSRIEKIKGDVRKKADWEKALEGVERVIHLAAEMDLLPHFSKFSEVNTTGTALLYETIVKKRLKIKKVVIASSQFVYGEGRYCDSKDKEFLASPRRLEDLEKGRWEVIDSYGKKAKPLPNLETHQDPQNQYSITKYSQELLGLRLGRLYDIPTVALRYSIVHGPRQSFRNAYSGALRIFTLKMLQGDPPPIYEDGRSFRDYVSIYDVARANLLVLEDKRADFEVFNVGGGRGYTVLELAKIIKEILGAKVSLKATHEFRLGDTRYSVSDIAKLKKLGWRPLHQEKETVKEYIEWLKTQKLTRDYAGEAEKRMRKMGVLKKARV